MFNYFKNKSNNLIISLRVSILSIFSILFLVLLLSLVSIFYFHVSAIVERASFLLMSESSYAALNEFTLELLPVEAVTVFTSKNIRQYLFDVNREDIIVPYVVHLLKATPLAQGAFWGDIHGNYIHVRKEKDGFSAQVINRNHIPATNTYLRLNVMHQQISKITKPLDFDPRQEIWYKLAEQKKKPIWTDYYLQKRSFFGLTVASPAIDDNGVFLGVFGVNVGLQSLSKYVSRQKITENSEMYILNNAGVVVAASNSNKNLSNIKDISPPGARSFAYFKAGGAENLKIRDHGIDYLVSFKRIDVLKEAGWLIAIIVPEVDFIHQIHHLEQFYILLDILIFLIGFVVMSNVVTRITKPISAIVEETKRIKNFELDEGKKVPSRIREVIVMQKAIEDMKTGLRSFKRFVPASLVRQLIETGEDLPLGGSKRELAVFFSDIENFTALAERSGSHELMQQVSRYFEELSTIIIRYHGTIDKYIGDSVMAFWGAPLHVDDPCAQVAHAALRIEKKVRELNALWQKHGLSPFFTRIGIHFGEVIVGNIGSSERLNYTALGDTVNIASHLVDVNKIYGTSILVSDTVYQQLKNSFVLRLVDQVTLKGKAEVTTIYELLADSKADLPFAIDQYQPLFKRGFEAYQAQQWMQAIEQFTACIDLYPQDPLAKVFVARCHRFLHEPPKDWDGVWHIRITKW